MKKLLLVSHQLDYSGAPNALLSAAAVLREMGNEVDLLPLAEGPLEAEFSAIGVRRIRATNFRGYDLIILNTAVSARVAHLIPGGEKYLIWLHESPLLFVHSDVPFIVSEAAEKATAILYPTENTGKEWSSYGPLRNEKLITFYCLAPVSLPDALADIRSLVPSVETPHPLKIITIDPFEYFRGYRTLAKAIKNIVDLGIDVHLTSVGSTTAQFKGLFNFLPPSRCAVFDRIPRSEVLKLLSSSDLYISNSSFATQNLGLCEASLVGLPSLATDIPVHRAWAKEMAGGTTLYRLFDSNDLTLRIRQILGSYRAYSGISYDRRIHAKETLSSGAMKQVFTLILSIN
jgi:glycosyltransferase involved in cell wall biosynthesis